MDTEHPWQAGPTELLTHALEHLFLPSEFDQRIAFLLLDVGVETIFKTFLELPEEVTGSTLTYSKRQEAVKGSFHDLVRGTFESGTARLQGVSAAHIKFYHDLRNKLYHQGNGITVPSEKAKAYAVLAVDLLHRLLDVALEPLLQRPQIELERKQRETLLAGQASEAQRHLRRSLQALLDEARETAEVLEPAFSLPSFEKRLEDWEEAFTTEERHWVMIYPDPIIMGRLLVTLPEVVIRFGEKYGAEPEQLVRFLLFGCTRPEGLIHLVDIALPQELRLATVYSIAQRLTEVDTDNPSGLASLADTPETLLTSIAEYEQQVKQMREALTEVRMMAGRAKRGEVDDSLCSPDT